MDTNLRREVNKLYIYTALMASAPIMPIVVLFFQSNGLTITQIFILQSVYAAAIFLLEIPSGYLADRVGYKKALVYSTILVLLGISLFIFYQVLIG